MQHCAGLESEHLTLECQIRGGSMALSDRKEHRCSEKPIFCDLQCGESLAVAVNRVMEEDFGVKRRLRAFIHGV